MSNRIQYLLDLHQQFNDSDFGGKLLHIPIRIKKNKTKDGWLEYHTQKRPHEGPLRGSGWYPNRDRLEDNYIVICDGTLDEGIEVGALLHEMVHQYQIEILDRPASHDAIFTSVARKLERKYKVDVR